MPLSVDESLALAKQNFNFVCQVFDESQTKRRPISLLPFHRKFQSTSSIFQFTMESRLLGGEPRRVIVCAAQFTTAGILCSPASVEMHFESTPSAHNQISASRIPTRKVSSWVAPRGCLPDRNGESLFSNEKLHAQHAPNAHTHTHRAASALLLLLLLELPFRPAG